MIFILLPLVADAGDSLSSTWPLYFDGACRGAEKQGSCGVVIYPPIGAAMFLGILLGDHVSNNGAEYQALLIGLRALSLLEASHIEVYGDSQPVVHQHHGHSRTLHPLMHYYSQLAHDLFTHFASPSYLVRKTL